MAASEVFSMTNANETCTAAAFTWAYMKLSGRATPDKGQFSENDDNIKRNMSNVKPEDHDVKLQASLMNCKVVKTESGVISSLQIAEHFKNNAPHVGIFWCSFHTVAYSYSHLDKQYFDNNVGLWKADKTADIVAKMDEIKTANGYVNWSGYAVLELGGQNRAM